MNYRADSSAWPCLHVSLLNLHSQHGVGSAASLPVMSGLQIHRQNFGLAEVTRGWDLKADSISPPAARRSCRLVKHFLRWVNARRWLRCCLWWWGPARQPSPPSCSVCPSPQHKLRAIPLQPKKSCWLHCGGDLGGGKAKGRARVGWSELWLVPDTSSPPWHGVAGNTLLLISTRAIIVFAEQDGFSHLPGSQRGVNDCPDDRDFCLLPMGQSGLRDSVPNPSGQGYGYRRSQRASFLTVRAQMGRVYCSKWAENACDFPKPPISA